MSKSALPPEQLSQFEHIQGEVQEFIQDALFRQGIDRLNAILDSMGDHDEYKLLRGALLSRRAELYLELEDDEAAWEDAQGAMNRGWYDATVHSIAGWAMYHMDDATIAEQQFTSSLALDPDRVASRIGRAMVYIDREAWDDARIDLSHAIKIDEQNASAFAMRAEIGIALGTLDAAVRDITRACELDPDDADYALFHARLLTATGDIQGGEAALAGAISGNDTPLEALLLRSHIRLLSADLDGAKKDAIQASNAYGEEAFAFVQLSHVQLAKGNSAMALKAAERAVLLDPSLPDTYLARAAARRLEGDEKGSNEDFDRARDEAIEMPFFMLGPTAQIVDVNGFNQTVLELLYPEPEPAAETEQPGPSANPFAGGIPGLGAGIPGLGGLDPSKMLDQVFDSDGNIKPAFKPILKMAMKNAPSLLKTVPPGMLKNMGGLDPSQLENIDMDNISEEQLESQMRLFYKMVKSGQNPMDFVKPDKDK